MPAARRDIADPVLMSENEPFVIEADRTVSEVTVIARLPLPFEPNEPFTARLLATPGTSTCRPALI